MTGSQEFIISHIDRLIVQFPFIQLKYEFISFDNSHFIEVMPSFVFKQNEDYIAAENYLRFAFIEKFPYQNIAFGTEDSLYKVEDVFYEKKGLLYDMNKFANESNFTSEINSIFEGTNVHFPNKIDYVQENYCVNINIIHSQQTHFSVIVDNAVEITGSITSCALAA